MVKNVTGTRLAGDCDVSGVKKVNLVANNGSGGRCVSESGDRHGVARRYCPRGAKEGMLGCRRRSLSSWKRSRSSLSKSVGDASDDEGRQARWTSVDRECKVGKGVW